MKFLRYLNKINNVDNLILVMIYSCCDKFDINKLKDLLNENL